MSDLVLVTGSSGYIAAHIVQQLLQNGYNVRGTVRSLQNERKVKPIRDLAEGNTNCTLELVEADLENAECWPKIVEGCKYVLHTASPFPIENPKHEDELIKPAVNGTLNVLRACGPSVQRVVLTSSVASVYGGTTAPSNGKAYTEADWANTEKCNTAYEKSKTLAEKAAWDYVKDLPEDIKFELAVINPSLVIGPMLTNVMGTSTEVLHKILSKDAPMLPKICFSLVDVREVAAAHLAAMTSPEANGQRHLVTGPNMWFGEMAKVIETEFKPMGYSIPSGNAPYPLLWVMGRFDKSIRMILPTVGKENVFDNSRMVDVLGVTPRPVNESIVETCYSLIEKGHMRKTDKYKPREQ